MSNYLIAWLWPYLLLSLLAGIGVGWWSCGMEQNDD